jgi:hypothetical protein
MCAAHPRWRPGRCAPRRLRRKHRASLCPLSHATTTLLERSYNLVICQSLVQRMGLNASKSVNPIKSHKCASSRAYLRYKSHRWETISPHRLLSPCDPTMALYKLLTVLSIVAWASAGPLVVHESRSAPPSRLHTPGCCTRKYDAYHSACLGLQRCRRSRGKADVSCYAW